MSLGFMDNDEPTTYYGEATAEAVKHFQRQLDMTEDGICGTETWDALFSASAPYYHASNGDSGTDIIQMQQRLFELGYLTDDSTTTKSTPSGVFACPSSDSYDRSKSTRHYAINDPKDDLVGRGFASARKGNCPMNISKIQSPSRRAALFDIDNWGSYPDPQAKSKAQIVQSGSGGTASWRHQGNNGANVCFADGHVEMRHQRSIPADYQADDEEGYFWGTAENN